MPDPILIEKARRAGITVIDDSLERRLKVLQTTSASAIDRFDQCERQWFGGYIEGDWAPQTPAQERGTAVDLEVQRHYRGEPVHPGWRDAVDGIVKLLPKNVIIQQKIVLPTFAGGPTLVGYPDFLYEESPGHAIVDDLKSTSDYKYAKTPEQLLEMIQPITYSAWIWTLPGVRSVRARHVTAKFKKDDSHPVGYKFMGARLSDPAVMSREHVEQKWTSLFGPIQAMVEAAKHVASFDAMPATGALVVDDFGKNACERFGGCHFRARCGFETFKGDGRMSGNGSNGTDLLSILNQHRAAQGQPPAQYPMPPQGEQPPTAAGYQPQAPAASQPVPPAQAWTQPPQQHQTPAQFFGGPLAGVVHVEPAPSPNPNHAHPGAVGIPGYAPGQPCNGRGHYASSNGQGFIPVEPGHRCPVCQPAMVVPPDAPARTSTPEEIKAVDEGAKKKGRPKKPKADPAEMLRVYSELNEKRGFSLNEVERLYKEGLVEDALAGKITPGMLRQPAPQVAAAAQVSAAVPPPAPPVAAQPIPGPAPTLQNATMTPEQVKEMQAQWYANSGPPQASGQLVEHPAHTMVREQLVKEGREPLPTNTPQVPPFNPSVATNQALPSTPPAGEAESSRQAAQQRLDQYVAQRRTRPLKLPATPPVVLVDCVVTKATGALARMPSDAVPLADWLAPVAELAAKAAVDENGKPAPVEDYRLVPFGRGKGILAAAVRECLDSLPAVVLVDSSADYASIFLECVAPHAALIVRGLR